MPRYKLVKGPWPRSECPEALAGECQDFRKAADRAVRKMARLRPKILAAIESGEATQSAIARELGWDRRRMHTWINSRGDV